MRNKQIIEEMCPYCENEIALVWDLEVDGHQAYCPKCGQEVMLCGYCPVRSQCDFKTDFNGQNPHCSMSRPKDPWFMVTVTDKEIRNVYVRAKNEADAQEKALDSSFRDFSEAMLEEDVSVEQMEVDFKPAPGDLRLEGDVLSLE